MSLINMTLLEMLVTVTEMGVDVNGHEDLIEDMFWDGHSPREIKEMIQVMEGDCSICVD